MKAYRKVLRALTAAHREYVRESMKRNLTEQEKQALSDAQRLLEQIDEAEQILAEGEKRESE